MKKSYFLIIVLTALMATAMLAQHRGDRRKNFREKIDQLEKIKLIEELNLTDEAAVKFFTKRSEFREKGKLLNDKIDSLSTMIRDKAAANDGQTSTNEWKKIIDEYLYTEKQLQKNKMDFFTSLQSMLSPQQMAEFLAFERRFREEVQDLILKGRPRPERE